MTDHLYVTPPKKVENTICNIAQITFTDVYYSNHNKAGRVRNITDNNKKRHKKP